jgi:phosphate starvation-inducible membrane PsiE
MKQQPLSEFCTNYKARMDELGLLLIETFHYYLTRFVIGASVVWSAVVAYAGMVAQGHATIGDILLLALATRIIRKPAEDNS